MDSVHFPGVVKGEMQSGGLAFVGVKNDGGDGGGGGVVFHNVCYLVVCCFWIQRYNKKTIYQIFFDFFLIFFAYLYIKEKICRFFGIFPGPGLFLSIGLYIAIEQR